MTSHLLTMLPVYLLGNLHCLGMCGPIALMLGTHRFAGAYLLGRWVSFTLSGWIAGGVGAVVNAAASLIYLPSAAAFIFGLALVFFGAAQLSPLELPRMFRVAPSVAEKFQRFAAQDSFSSLFFIGFSTIFLPCGQTLVVYSGCALTGSAFEGVIHGGVFAILTTPSLFLAMKAKKYLASLRLYYKPLMGVLSLFVGALSLCRGLADLEIIPHLVISDHWHLVLF